MQKIELFSVTWSTDTAGPSPYDNMRTEIFFKGCDKAILGNPCLGCFNRRLWDPTAERTYTPKEIADQINRFAPNKYVTIGGGEPTDKLEALIELTGFLKEYGFHIMVYTWKDLEVMLMNHTNERQGFLRLLDNIDMLVDGIFDYKERLYKGNAGDGLLSSVGSGNQTIWDVRDYNTKGRKRLIGYKMRDLAGIYVKPSNNDLVYITHEAKEPLELIVRKEVVA